MARPVMDRFIHGQASRGRSHGVIVGYRFKAPFRGRNTESESRQNLAQPFSAMNGVPASVNPLRAERGSRWGL